MVSRSELLKLRVYEDSSLMGYNAMSVSKLINMPGAENLQVYV